MTASPEVRAERRYRELLAKGTEVSYEEVKANVEKRDYIDSHREVGPLRQTEDAVVVDNSDMTVEEEVEMSGGNHPRATGRRGEKEGGRV